jgi:hypothetical protein
MKKRKRVSLRVINFYGHKIPLDFCWGDAHSVKHVHNVRRQDEMGDDELYTNIKRAIDFGAKRWCRQCILEYPLNTLESRAFYEVVRLNDNTFAGNLPFEIILMIYKHLLRKPLLFKECSELKSTESNHP